MRTTRTLSTILAFSALFPAPALAQWQLDGAPVCKAAQQQSGPVAVPDGAGGAIIVWYDRRNDQSVYPELQNGDLYAQRINAAGVSQWATDGVPVCTAAGPQIDHRVITDGAGGAIIVWTDYRDASTNIYAQRINAAGVRQWALTGVPLCNDSYHQYWPAVTTDGLGGAITAWNDERGVVYAQRVLANGSVQWGMNGSAMSAISGQMGEAPTIASDGAGGVIVAYRHALSGPDRVIYAQRFDGTGLSQWGTDGVPVTSIGTSIADPQIASDGAGGAVIAWPDSRSGNLDIFAQRMNATGAALWTPNGVTVCSALSNQEGVCVVSDGAGGMVVVWSDNRTNSAWNIYGQRINSAGATQWTSNGVPICTTPGNQFGTVLIGGGDGGAIISWTGGVNTQYAWPNDVFAQRLNGAGQAQFGTNGVVICAREWDQEWSTIASDGTGGAIIAWEDMRIDSSADVADIYAQRLGLVAAGVLHTPSATGLVLGANHPNPFSGTTSFDFHLIREGNVAIEVFDAAGRRVRHADTRGMKSGATRLEFDGLDDAGNPLASGVYFYRVLFRGESVTRKIIISR